VNFDVSAVLAKQGYKFPDAANVFLGIAAEPEDGARGCEGVWRGWQIFFVPIQYGAQDTPLIGR
jgi:hypothetical protein